MTWLTHGSLFDGAGGMRSGFEDAGFQTKWALDILNGHDITRSNPADYQRVGLISGGPPCQRGSELAKFDRSRTFVTLWPEMLRFVAALMPEWVVVENVEGFKWQMVDWTADLQRLGYGCAGQLIDSRHWVPQQRTRAFIVARLGANGLALWNHLYAPGVGASRESRDWNHQEAHGERDQRNHPQAGDLFTGPCDKCVRGGILAGNDARKFALMGAGNAVTQKVARFLAERIKQVISEFPVGSCTDAASSGVE